jgi:hypothetical protein
MTITAEQAGTDPCGSAGALATWVADLRPGDVSSVVVAIRPW